MNKIVIATLFVIIAMSVNAQTNVKDKKARERATSINQTTATILGLSKKENSDVNKSVGSLLSENYLLTAEKHKLKKWQDIISKCSSIITNLEMVFAIYENYDKSFEYMKQATNIISKTDNWALLAEKEKLDTGFGIIFDEIESNLDLLLLILNQKVISGKETTVHTKEKTRVLLINEIYNSSIVTLKKSKTCQMICYQLDRSTFKSITLDKLISK